MRKIRRRFTSKLVFRILAKNVVGTIWLANGKIVSDVRLNAMSLDVWEANANQDSYILIRLLWPIWWIIVMMFLYTKCSIIFTAPRRQKGDLFNMSFPNGLDNLYTATPVRPLRDQNSRNIYFCPVYGWRPECIHESVVSPLCKSAQRHLYRSAKHVWSCRCQWLERLSLCPFQKIKWYVDL